MIVTAFISDRGDQYLPQCVNSFWRYIKGQSERIYVVDDEKHTNGLAGSVREAWDWALSTPCDYLFHVEEDFTFNEDVDLFGLQWILDNHPELAQVVLKRNPAESEMAFGGIIEQDPGAYEDWQSNELAWCEHDKIFSLNPCLIPRHVLELGWPDGNEAEFTQQCLERGWRFAFYGRKTDPPRVTHHGIRHAAWMP